MNCILFLCALCVVFVKCNVSVPTYNVWGPGLEPHKIVMPARYFFVEPTDYEQTNLNKVEWKVSFSGKNSKGAACRIWTNVLDRKDGSVIVRYKLYETCVLKEIHVVANGLDINNSPFIVNSLIYPDSCSCDKYDCVERFIDSWKCGEIPLQIVEDLKIFEDINWDVLRDQVIKEYNNPSSVSLCHYVIKSNVVYRQCYGKYVGFKMFMDSILLSITRKTNVSDIEFFANLGDWPLVKNKNNRFPIFSWCGSTETIDIVMPTYDITESTLENMGRVMLDMLSVQGNVKETWRNRISKAFWRGRDSNRERLNLVNIAKENPELFNVSLTNYFFFRDEQEKYGAATPHVSFFDFFDYKYQINIDGTVAAYRFPYLMAGAGLIFKQHSKYYEHFYKSLEKDVHYLLVQNDLSDLVETIKWAEEHQRQAEAIAKNAQDFAVHNLLPQNIICYYTVLLNEFSKRITSDIKVLDGMEQVPQPQETKDCKCQSDEAKDEL